MKNRPDFLVGRDPAGRRGPRGRAVFAVVCIAIASLAVPLVGCGGEPPSRSVRSTPADASGSAGGPPAGGALSAQLSKTLPADGASTAVVSFAVFRPAPLENRERALKVAEVAVEKAFRRPPLVLAPLAAGQPPRPELIAAPVDDALPLDIDALAADAGDAAAPLKAARSVVFVRYAGKALPDDAQVRGTALGAAALVAPGTVVVDPGTRRVWTGEAFFMWTAAEDWLADQVTVDAQQAEDGSVTFFTRGMARFGQPDLEAAGVPAAEARARFGAFQTLLAALRAHGPAKPGDTVGGVKLGRCTRPPEAIERTCVSM